MSGTTGPSLKILSFTTKLIVSLRDILSEKSSLTVFQNVLLSDIELMLMLAKYFFLILVYDKLILFDEFSMNFISPIAVKIYTVISLFIICNF